MIIGTQTRTGAIFCDDERWLEWLYVGDYGKENNIKADFLGLHKEINSVPHHRVNLEDKMVVTISTQKGCPMKCKFCDCWKVGCRGNASQKELCDMVSQAIRASGCKHTRRFNLHLARMGEPAFNAKNVLLFIKNDLRNLVNAQMSADVIHPVFTTMCPKSIPRDALATILTEFCNIKNNDYDGEAGLQLSINSTDDQQRGDMFNGMSHSLSDIARIATSLPKPKGRKYTLNFAVTAETKLNAQHLTNLFDPAMFIVKITPIHETNEAKANGITTDGGYDKYDVYRQFEEPLLEAGWDVIVFVPSKEEDMDRITCGNALLAGMKNGSRKI